MRLLVVLAVLVVLSILAEVVVRRVDLFGISYYKDVNRYVNEAVQMVPEARRPDGRIFQNKPGVDLSLVRFDYRTDAGGFRSSEAGRAFRLERAEPRERMRILFLGDSVTLAWGVDDEDSWIRLVEGDGFAPDGRPLECLNAGHLIYDSVQEADFLAANGPLLAPDAVVLTYVANDFESTWEMYEELMQSDGSIRPSEVTWRDTVRAKLVTWYRGLYGSWHFLSNRFGADVRSTEEIVVEEEPTFIAGWPASEAALDRMLETTKELGVPLVVLDHTVPEIARVRAWCEANEVPWHPFTFTPEETAQDIENSPADAHANELGQRFLAEKARRALRAEGLLGS